MLLMIGITNLIFALFLRDPFLVILVQQGLLAIKIRRDWASADKDFYRRFSLYQEFDLINRRIAKG